MARTKIILMTCPNGHSFITLQSFGHTFSCTECDQSFDSWQEGVDLARKTPAGPALITDDDHSHKHRKAAP